MSSNFNGQVPCSFAERAIPRDSEAFQSQPSEQPRFLPSGRILDFEKPLQVGIIFRIVVELNQSLLVTTAGHSNCFCKPLRARDSMQVQGVHGGCELQVEAGRAESFVESSKGGSKVRFVETATQSLAPAVLDLPLAPAVRVCVLFFQVGLRYV